MKNIIKSFLLSIAAIPLFASCAQDNFSAPKGESLVFTATIANATRTSIDIDGSAGKVNWVAGDEILINGVAYVATPDPSDATKATFEKKNASDADAKDIFGEYYATYRCTFDPETGEGIIPAKQVCTAANMLPAPMVAVSENTSLSFLNICGVLEINLKGTKTVKDIEVSADNIGLSGKFTVLDGQSATIIDNEKGSVTLDCGDGIALTSEGTKFYVPVPAGEYTGLKISVHTADNNSWSTTAVRTATVEANKIYSAEFTPEFVGSPARYSNDGGATWTYAESLAAAINGITTTAKADGKVELLKDCTIESQVKISGKKFIWNGNGHTVSFVSKYDEITDNYQGAIHVMSSSDVDFTDTKFVGQGTSETATDRPFAVVASTASFGKDVTISDFKNSRPYGGAIWGNKQSVIYLKDNLKITNCHNAPASSSYGGGALCSDGSVYVQDDVLISGCSSAFWGGAILSNYNNETSKLIMSGRARIENCKSGKGGGGFYGNGKIELSDEVTISGCQAGTCGGAFEARKVTALSGKVLVENCTAETVGGAIALAVGANLTLAGDILIKDCTSKTHGGGICNTGTTSGISIEMKGNAHITGCKALDGDGGGIRDNATASTMTVSENALIDNCSCTGKGGGLYQAGTYTIGGNVRIENCSAKNGGGIAVWKNATL
ncbi:MAG: right-handed parallel beta-helix repeat-containing protein, partial [Bacteroidales bacterium]|nr:right-handed parallel beta-helix repeat-containing protein [Bacteroidales bacterium]